MPTSPRPCSPVTPRAASREPEREASHQRQQRGGKKNTLAGMYATANHTKPRSPCDRNVSANRCVASDTSIPDRETSTATATSSHQQDCKSPFHGRGSSRRRFGISAIGPSAHGFRFGHIRRRRFASSLVRRYPATLPHVCPPTEFAMRASQSPSAIHRRDFLSQTLAGAIAIAGVPFAGVSADDSMRRPSIGFQSVRHENAARRGGPQGLLGGRLRVRRICSDGGLAVCSGKTFGRRTARHSPAVDRPTSRTGRADGKTAAGGGTARSIKPTSDRFKRAFDLSRDLAPHQTPLIETILLVVRPNKWSMLKDKFVERLRDWAAVAADTSRSSPSKHTSPERCISRKTPSNSCRRSTRQRCNWHSIRATSNFATSRWRCLESDGRADAIHSRQRWQRQTRSVSVSAPRRRHDRLRRVVPLAEIQPLQPAPSSSRVSGQLSSKPDYDPIARPRRSAGQC